MKPFKTVIGDTMFVKREAQLMANLESLNSLKQLYEKCKILSELSLVYLKAGDIDKLLQVVELLDAELFGVCYDNFWRYS